MDEGDNRSETHKVPEEIPTQNRSEKPDDGINHDQDSASAPDGKLLWHADYTLEELQDMGEMLRQGAGPDLVNTAGFYAEDLAKHYAFEELVSYYPT
ncbi:MAG TPA: hypothetical protein DCZ91_23415 [Lachnospiraceae bacterium]|nr:hypothetical protein [Lachnospiraceae bacterium]